MQYLVMSNDQRKRKLRTYSQTSGNDKPTNESERYSVYISAPTPVR